MYAHIYVCIHTYMHMSKYLGDICLHLLATLQLVAYIFRVVSVRQSSLSSSQKSWDRISWSQSHQ